MKCVATFSCETSACSIKKLEECLFGLNILSICAYNDLYNAVLTTNSILNLYAWFLEQDLGSYKFLGLVPIENKKYIVDFQIKASFNNNDEDIKKYIIAYMIHIGDIFQCYKLETTSSIFYSVVFVPNDISYALEYLKTPYPHITFCNITLVSTSCVSVV